MLEEPLFILLILLAVVVFAQKWSVKFRDAAVMRYIPTPVLCYVPPTILTTFGVLPMSSVVYDWIGRYVLPACLILLLMTTNLKGLAKVGKTALIAMFVATSSVIVGGIVTFVLFRDYLGPESWSAIGTMTGSLIGGTVNMIAVKQATGLSEELLTPLFISDITVVYVWMTLLMILSTKQKTMDRFLHARRQVQKGHRGDTLEAGPKGSRSLPLLLLIGFGIGYALIWVSYELPEIGTAVTRGTWIIVLVTTAGLFLSTTEIAKRESKQALQVGYFLLYLVLAATGAKANLLAILNAPVFLVMGFLWVAIHALLLIGAGRMFRIPSAMLATASQANLGGVASAPVVASTYDPRLVPIALILAIFGNAAGNYLGILTAQILRSF